MNAHHEKTACLQSDSGREGACWPPPDYSICGDALVGYISDGQTMGEFETGSVLPRRHLTASTLQCLLPTDRLAGPYFFYARTFPIDIALRVHRDLALHASHSVLSRELQQHLRRGAVQPSQGAGKPSSFRPPPAQPTLKFRKSHLHNVCVNAILLREMQFSCKRVLCVVGDTPATPQFPRTHATVRQFWLEEAVAWYADVDLRSSNSWW